MKKVSQGGTELIVFKRQETGNWVGGLLPEEQLLPDQTVLETGKIATVSQKGPCSFFLPD